jgi:hypothetical protein
MSDMFMGTSLGPAHKAVPHDNAEGLDVVRAPELLKLVAKSLKTGIYAETALYLQLRLVERGWHQRRAKTLRCLRR